MTQIHQIQCPHCHHQFEATDDQLAVKSGYASCPQCKKIFSVIDQLSRVSTQSMSTQSMSTQSLATSAPVNSSINPTINSPVTSNVTSKITSTTDTKPVSKVLFSDDFGIDDLENLGKAHVADKQQTDNGQIENRGIINPPNATQQQCHAKTPVATPVSPVLDFDSLKIDDNFEQPSTTDIPAFATTVQTDTPDDEAWLAQLLAEENPPAQTEDTPANFPAQPRPQPTNTAHLSHAVGEAELGRDDPIDAPLTAEEYHQRAKARFEKHRATHKAAASSHAITTVWVIGNLGLLALLAFQLVFFNIESLLKHPSHAARLHGICRTLPLDCQLPIASTEMIDVNMLSLNPSETSNKKTDLILTLKNTAASPNIYPNLKVTLGSGNQTKAQFILLTQQYLPAHNSRLLPGQFKVLKLRIDYPRKSFEQVNIELYY